MGSIKHVNAAAAVVWRRMRTERKLRREYIAVKLGLSKSAIDKIEQGALPVKLAQVYQYCDVLGCSPMAFMEGLMAELPPPPHRKRKKAVTA